MSETDMPTVNIAGNVKLLLREVTRQTSRAYKEAVGELLRDIVELEKVGLTEMMQRGWCEMVPDSSLYTLKTSHAGGHGALIHATDDEEVCIIEIFPFCQEEAVISLAKQRFC